MARRTNLTLKNTEWKIKYLVDVALPIEINKIARKYDKIQKNQYLGFKLREWRQNFRVEIISVIIGYVGGGIWKLTNYLNKPFEGKTLTDAYHKIQTEVWLKKETIT